MRILALESVRNQVVVVGEDLGTVEPVVRETLARFGILSYRLFYFEKNERRFPARSTSIRNQALVSSTTHDLPTLAGFWIGADIEARRAAGSASMTRAAVRRSASRAREKQKMLDVLFRLGLLPGNLPRSARGLPGADRRTAQRHRRLSGVDAFAVAGHQSGGSDQGIDQQNLPGTTWQYPNWGRKMTFTVEQLSTEKAARDFTAMFRHWLIRTGRTVPHAAKA